jgi:hypothetical protein
MSLLQEVWRALLAALVAALAWGALVSLSFYVPGSPNRHMAEMAGGWPDSAGNLDQILETMNRSVWFGSTVVTAVAGLLFSLLFVSWWRTHRLAMIGASSLAVAGLLAFYGGANRVALSAIATYLVGVLFPPTLGVWRLHRATDRLRDA